MKNYHISLSKKQYLKVAQLVHDSKRILSQTGDRYKQEKALIDGIEKELAKASNATYLPTQ